MNKSSAQMAVFIFEIDHLLFNRTFEDEEQATTSCATARRPRKPSGQLKELLFCCRYITGGLLAEQDIQDGQGKGA